MSHQLPIPNIYQASAQSHRYIGRWAEKRKLPLLDLGRISKVEWLKKSLGKSGRFRTSGSTFWSRSTGSRFARLDLGRIRKNFEGWMAEKFPWQKWSISNLWEHFLLPKHQIPFWLIFVLAKMKRSSPNPYNYRLKWTDVHETLIITG